MNLQEFNGLTDEDPLHHYLGILDKIVGEEFDWTDLVRTRTKQELVNEFWHSFGVPAEWKEGWDFNKLGGVNRYKAFLEQHGEPVLADLVAKLEARRGEKGLDDDSIRIVLMWLLANLDHLAETSLEERGKLPRQLGASWKPSCEE